MSDGEQRYSADPTLDAEVRELMAEAAERYSIIEALAIATTRRRFLELRERARRAVERSARQETP